MSRVAIVGGGPAGLAAAIALRRHGADVVVLERDARAGGVPRHCDHWGFGVRDLHRVLGGPSYAARYVGLAERAGVDVRTCATATGWDGPTTLAVTSPRGIESIAADAVLLATGCRERPRSARLVPGTRPAGVLTTGALQQLVHLGRERVGRRAVVVGAEHVSFSAVLTLREAGCEIVAMVTEHPAHQTYAALRRLAAPGVPILGSSRVAEIAGARRVESVVVTSARDGTSRVVACDTVVFTGDWIPDHELARRRDLAMDAGTRGPSVDQHGRTSAAGVFAAGNLVHAAESADVAALGARATAAAIATFLHDGRWPADPVPIGHEPPVAWVSPTAVAPDAHPGARPLLFRVDRPCRRAIVALVQGDRTLWSSRRRRLDPNRSLRVPPRAIAGVAPGGEAVRLVVG